MTSSAAPRKSATRKKASASSDVLNEAVLARTAPAPEKKASAAEEAFSNIETNTFAKIMFDPEITPEAKREAIVQALTFAGTREENRERVREFETMKEYLQHVRSEVSKEIIRLTDTEAFAELKRIYDEINGALINFDNKMAPLTEIIDAVYTLRTNGETLNAFKEIQEDREQEKVLLARRGELSGEVYRLDTEIARLNSQLDILSRDKAWFGLGKIRPEAQRKMGEIQVDIASRMTALAKAESEVATLESESAAHRNKAGKFAKEKEKLRELLDISTDAHRQRQEDLVAAALSFVETAKERIGAVRSHLGGMNDQVENLGDSNGQITQVYAILNEGIKGAGVQNQKLRAELVVPEGVEEDLIAKMARQGRETDLNAHIKLLDSSAADTMLTYTDLTTQTIRIKAMKDSNDEQIVRARAMHAQGVAGVADRLSTVLQAVSSAAINESSSMARDTLDAMAETTNRIAQKEVIRVATGFGEQNEQLVRAMEGLSQYGEVLRAGTDITRTGVAEMREKLEEMQTMAQSVQDDIRASLSVHAEVGQEASEAEKAKPSKAPVGIRLPFKMGQ